MSTEGPRPPCVGTFEQGDPECEGSDPCTWRDKCAAFKIHLERNKKDSSEWIDPETGRLTKLDEESFNDWLHELRKLFDISEGVPRKEKRKKKRKPEPKPEPQSEPEIVFKPILKQFKKGAVKNPGATNAKWAAKKREDTVRLLDHFVDNLRAELPRRRKWASGEQAALPGEFYLVDRIAKSRYLAIYCRRSDTWDAPIVAAYMRPENCTFEARLPMGVEEFKRALASRTEKEHLSDVEAFKKGAFISRVKGVGYAKASVLARTLARLVKNGKIELP